jgi:ADP-ribose 1''-phosphate phosphatase
MSKIIYKKQSLFDAPKGSLLCHATNCQGVWGSGIAKEFKTRFPKSYLDYNEYCRVMPINVGPIEGSAMLCDPENEYQVGCLMTSGNFGSKVDQEEQILNNTYSAILELFEFNQFHDKRPIYSNKFNSGLFNVPWEKTEAILLELLKDKDYDWVVCDPDLKET